MLPSYNLAAAPLLAVLLATPLYAQPRITEFVAINDASLTDGEGKTPDWIEIHNPTGEPLSLAGYHLTDDPEIPDRYSFPADASIPAGDYLVVFASNKEEPDYRDLRGNLHTDFSLDGGGEYLALVGPDDSVLQEFAPKFPAQFEDVSYGFGTGDSVGYFTRPTPGDPNGPTPLLGFVSDTRFSMDRGYYTEPFLVEITTETPDATIRFTTDGTPPSRTRGRLYTGPLTISTTTTLRAMAFRQGYHDTNVDTQTYLFVQGILRQRPRGYPTTWSGVPADYEMDPQIVRHPAYRNEFDEAFAALPTLSLVFAPDALFHPSTGIYQRPSQEGIAWERPLSVEFFVPNGSEPGFQIDAGIRIQGGSSRNTDTPKHSFSLRFRADYGSEKLRYPLFEKTPSGETAVERFDLLQLRPEYNFGWMHRHWYQAERALYGRDQWTSDLYNAMGQNGSHGRWVHLFLNGIYWGLYDVHERPDADHMANYFGGVDDEYDTVNSSRATNGDLVAYNTMMDIAYGNIESLSTYNGIQRYLDLDAFIDYMLVNAYVGNRDWDGHNWRAARKREPGAGFLFFPWDTEFAISQVAGGVFPTPPDFFSTSLNTNVTTKNGNRRPTGLHQRLSRNAEYRLRYADHIRRHMFNGGVLTPEKAAATWRARSPSIAKAIVAESARWGDFRRDVLPGRWNSNQFDLYTRDHHYLPVLDWLFETYIPQRTNIVFQQLRSQGLYPSTDAPDFSQHGGTVPRGFVLQIDAPAPIYYTNDGSDPRRLGGGIAPAAQSLPPGQTLTLQHSTHLKARARTGSGQWSALTEATFTISATDLRISEIMYRPAEEPLAEFLELHNSGPHPIALTGLRFTAGIVFDFDEHSTIDILEPNERLLIVRDLDAFRKVHGNVHDALIAGTFQERTVLSNDGETLTISDANREQILNLTYNDADPWADEADGNGRSLVASGDDLDSPLGWRPSAEIDGNPGTSDRTKFVDGSPLDYALATPFQFAKTEEGITLTYFTHLTADDATISIEISAGLDRWTPLPPVVLGQQLHDDSERAVTVMLPDQEELSFVRLVVTIH